MVNEFMTPENAALLLGAVALLIGAVSKAIEWIGKAIGDFIKARADVRRIQAQAAAEDINAENVERLQIANVLEKLAEQNGRWPDIAADFATAQNQSVSILEGFRQTNVALNTSMKDMTAENKALRISLEAWPKAVDNTLAGLDQNIVKLSKQVGEFETSHEFIREHLTLFKPQLEQIVQHMDEFKPQVKRIIDLLDKLATLPPPDPPYPPKKDTPENVKPLNADAAKDKATLDSDAGQGKLIA